MNDINEFFSIICANGGSWLLTTLLVTGMVAVLVYLLYKSYERTQMREDEQLAKLESELKVLADQTGQEVIRSVTLFAPNRDGSLRLVPQAVAKVGIAKNALLTVGNTDKGVYSGSIAARDILSVEVITDVVTTRLGVGAFGGDTSGLIFGSVSNNTVRGVWLKVLVRDVYKPWIVLTMPDIATAELWRGAIQVITHRDSGNFEHQAIQSISATEPPKRVPSSDYADDGLLPI